MSLKIKLCFIPKRVTEKMFHNFYISHDLESKKSHFVQKLFFLKVLKFCEHFCSEAIRGIPVIRISSDFNKMGFMSNAVQKNKLLSKIFDNFLSKRFTLGYKIWNNVFQKCFVFFLWQKIVYILTLVYVSNSLFCLDVCPMNLKWSVNTNWVIP